MNILPTGGNMVTRTPIQLQLRNNNENIIYIGYNQGNQFHLDKKIEYHKQLTCEYLRFFVNI